ncbi:MAG: hypothetical protein DHS20C18_03680 [Saprospiraceae bacterium]|nr:MAG: hypothetical protein DHS20C18_03680 [Saprospiraceae bacterium]
MSKKKSVKKSKKQVKATQKQAVSTSVESSFGHEGWKTIDTSGEERYRLAFWATSVIVLFLMVILSLGTGINGDDSFQVDYSEKLVDYYTSMGQDTAALNIADGNMHYYGGFFEVITGFVNRGLGLDEFTPAYHKVRHVFIALFGFLSMLFVGLLVRETAGWRAALLALLLLLLSPGFLGHSLMNPKDIPFAAGFSMALYYLVLVLRQMPKPAWKQLLGLSIGVGIALGTRAGGLLLVAYLFLFAALDFLNRAGLKNIGTHFKVGLRYLAHLVVITIIGYLIAILFWPAALVSPIKLPLEALAEFSKIGTRIRLLFEGDNVMSDVTPWYYAISWIGLTVPLFTLAGLIGGLVLLRKMVQQYSVIPVALVFFAAIFPVFYVIIKDSSLHDGWRHLTFVYPPMVAAATLFWVTLEKTFENRRNIKYAIWGILALLMLEPAIFIARNPHYSYVYFNPIAGGVSGAFGSYETDYWGISVKQAIDWMEEENIIGDNVQDTVVIATTFYYNVSRQLGSSYRDRVKVKYVRFNERYTQDWQYGIFPSRFFRGPHLRAGTWPNSKTIKVVRANGTPLLAIEKDTEGFAYAGEKASKENNWQVAVEAFAQELKLHPDNELAWLGAAKAYLNAGDINQAITSSQQALSVAPENETAYFYLGVGQLNKQDLNAAMATFVKLLEINPDNSGAYYYLALIHEQRGEDAQALRNALLAVEKNPRFKNAYLLVARLYEKQGDSQNAARYQQAASRF